MVATGRWILRQPMMTRVLIGLLPLAVWAVRLYGWRIVVMLALANATGFLTEWLFCRAWKQPVSSAVFVTATLLVFGLTPAAPLWMAVLGTLFALVFGKMAFGGFGRNVFNPALTGRAFLYLSFGAVMTARWSVPFSGALEAFTQWAPDAVTHATPGMLLKSGTDISLSTLFFGLKPGTIGGCSPFLAILGGLYLIATRTANYRIPLAALVGFFLVHTLFWKLGLGKAAHPAMTAMAGSFLVAIFFYATDPVSAAQTEPGRWIYGFLVGALSSVIGSFSVWPAGSMFAILLANMFAPLLDWVIRQRATPKAPASAGSLTGTLP